MNKLLLALLLVSSVAQADLLYWELPTERENGDVLYPEELDSIIVYRNNTEYAVLGGSFTELEIPSACVENVWSVVAVAQASLSEMSDYAVQAIEGVSCRPKPPSGLTVRSQ